MMFKRSNNVQLPVEGFHLATVLRYKEGKLVETRSGDSPTVWITFETDDDQIVSHSFFMNEGLNRLMNELITATIDTNEEEVHLDDVIGKRCGIKIKHRGSTNGQLYANIVEVIAESQLEHY